MTAAPPDGVEPRPDAAVSLFGERTPLADGFVRHLATTGVQWGLLGPRELPRLWSRHVLNCAVLGELLPPRADVLDLGSGAGLPGLALAIAREDLHLTLVEPLERRTTWLQMVADDLGLAVTVRRARAEQLAGRLSVGFVTARAVAGLSTLGGWALPLLEPGGELLAVKGRTAAQELGSSEAALRRLGAVELEVVRCGAALLAAATTVVRVRVGATRATDRRTPG